MSKSSPAGCINLLDPLKTTEKKIKSAVTDSGSEVVFDETNKAGVSNLLTILSAYSGTDIPTLVTSFQGKMYGDLKKAVAEAVLAFVGPVQERVNELMSDPAELESLMRKGSHRAREIAAATVTDVYSKVGFVHR